MFIFFISFSTKASIVDSWFMMSSKLWDELPILSLISIYLLIVIVIAPRFMKNRAAYDLTYVTRVYDIFQVCACATMTIQFYRAGWTFGKALSCKSTLPTQNYIKVLEIWWFCIFIRSAELLETIFFILRKKSSQVTFLHVYHHVSSLFIVWIPLKYGGSELVF